MAYETNPRRSNSALYFLVGGLLVAVAFVVYFLFGGSGGDSAPRVDAGQTQSAPAAPAAPSGGSSAAPAPSSGGTGQ